MKGLSPSYYVGSINWLENKTIHKDGNLFKMNRSKSKWPWKHGQIKGHKEQLSTMMIMLDIPEEVKTLKK